MISFEFDFVTGEIFKVKGNKNDKFQTVLNDFILNQCPKNRIIKGAICNATKVHNDKTLIENKINEGSKILIIVEINPNAPSNNNNNLFPNNMQAPNNNFISPLQNNILVPNNIVPFPNNMQIPNNNIFPFPNNILFPNISNNNSFFNPFAQITNPNIYILKFMHFLLYQCNVPYQLIDEDWNCLDNSWRVGKKSGPPNYLKNYYSPQGWFAIGLKVWNLYDNGDNTWLSSQNVEGEWYIAYHPIKTINSISGILINGFRKGPFQNLKDRDNINPLTNEIYPECGEGVYFIPNINDAINYTNKFNYLGNEFRVVFMCRINPESVRICNVGDNNERWIVNGDKLNDINGRKRDEEVRPYRILFYIEK